MKRLLLMLSAGVLLVGCSSEDEAPEPIRPVLSVKVEPQVQSQLAEAKQMRDSSQISNESYMLKVIVILELAKPAPITANHTRQLFTDTRWHRCELVPHMCATGGIRYPSLPGKNIGSAMGQWQIMEHLT